MWGDLRDRGQSAASRWERTHRVIGSLPISRQEIEAALMLALPLVALPADISGEWVLASPASQGAGEEMEPALAAVSAVVANGELVSLSSGAASTPTTWALGTADAWLDAMVDGCCDNLRLRGPDTDLVGIVVMGIHGALFPNR
jgi:hypothetical protein